MRWIAIVLLLGVFIVHDTPQWIVEGTGYPRNWFFYGLIGAWTALLSAVTAPFFWEQPHSLWRSLALAALAISFIEGMEMPACLLALDPANVNRMPSGYSLCDYVVGFPIGKIIECLYFLAVLYILWRALATRAA